jgi:hypothetical protein
MTCKANLTGEIGAVVWFLQEQHVCNAFAAERILGDFASRSRRNRSEEALCP